jgi:hypothetical protein
MANVTNNLLLKGMSGRAGNKIYRTIKNKTFSGKIPDMSGITPSKKQKQKRSLFASAVKFARSVMNDPAESARYKTPDGSVYHAAIKEYMGLFSPASLRRLSLTPGLKNGLKGLSLTDPQFRAIAFIIKYQVISNGFYQKINGVSKATATRHLHELARYRIIQSNKGRGAGAHYIMGSLLKKIGSQE